MAQGYATGAQGPKIDQGLKNRLNSTIIRENEIAAILRDVLLQLRGAHPEGVNSDKASPSDPPMSALMSDLDDAQGHVQQLAHEIKRLI